MIRAVLAGRGRRRNTAVTAFDRELLLAAGRGDCATVRLALDSGADVEARDEHGRTPLLLAALADHVDAARLLLAAGADPDAQDDRDDSPWLVTGVTGSVAMMRLLLPHDPDLRLRDRYGGVCLIPAAERGHVAYVRAVLEETGIDVDHVNRLGWTALLEAVILGDGGRAHQQVVALLLAAGADPGLADREGVTPLRHAERRGFEEIAALLRRAAR
ncbi:ankyrin repeat domain-containing protein [Streptomyces sp. NPDC053367]|uniref:ankyrin repeat domain-containing protein n=1 Tax=Streptomyces sp. NPDC053367 TaxID=3365700 RepID=UPI0037D97A74